MDRDVRQDSDTEQSGASRMMEHSDQARLCLARTAAGSSSEPSRGSAKHASGPKTMSGYQRPRRP
jgi:hypothetical protein